jgi:MoaA/NifB/PqqE/SkfB family radical SAM enzyme
MESAVRLETSNPKLTREMGVYRRSWHHPRLDWLQVEVTTHCPAACVYCPRTVYRRLWRPRHMSLETFRLLSASLARCGMVYLQGWGEPLVHPELFEMVRLAKAAGCRVGMTTSGMPADEQTCLRLVREGVDLVAFSLAGTDERNDTIRRGTHFRQVVEGVRTLERSRRLLGSARPAVHLAYLSLRSRWQELRALPALMKDLGVERAVVSTLDFVAAPGLAAEAVLPATEEFYRAARARLEEVARAGRRLGLSIRYWLASPQEEESEERTRGPAAGLPWLFARSPACTENIQRSAFVGADGSVSPCVYVAVPASGATHVVAGAERPYARISFGNVHETPFEVIWRSRDYAAFRGAHRRGELPEGCRDCPRPRMVGGG